MILQSNSSKSPNLISSILMNGSILLGVILFSWESGDFILLYHIETLLMIISLILLILLNILYALIQWVFIPSQSTIVQNPVFNIALNIFILLAFLGTAGTYIIFQSILVAYYVFAPEAFLAALNQQEIAPILWESILKEQFDSLYSLENPLLYAYSLSLGLQVWFLVRAWKENQMERSSLAIQQAFQCGYRLFLHGMVLFGGAYLMLYLDTSQTFIVLLFMLILKSLLDYKLGK